MTKWSLPGVLGALHDDVEYQLRRSRKTQGHPVSKGDASESVWLTMLREYLPERYAAEKATVVDSMGVFSEQMDVVIFDRQYSPFMQRFHGQLIVPAESVYGVFESKQEINATEIKYARKKVASVRKLSRTSLPIPHAGGRYRAKTPGHILGGLLTFDSGWNPPLGKALMTALEAGERKGRLDMGCVGRHGAFWSKTPKSRYVATPSSRAATIFLLELIARLQALATVPMIDVRAYAKWLSEGP